MQSPNVTGEEDLDTDRPQDSPGYDFRKDVMNAFFHILFEVVDEECASVAKECAANHMHPSVLKDESDSLDE